MIYSNIYGGLGNQMFQYAVAKNISVQNKVDLKLDIYKIDDSYLRNFLLKKFNISAEIANDDEVKKYRWNKYLNYFLKKNPLLNQIFGNKFFEKNEFIFDNNLLNLKEVYLEGYWQCFKYFDKIRPVLLKEFTLIEEMNNENKLVLDKIKESNSVSIHIRRGDYLSNSKNIKLYNVVDLEYYNKAIDYINKKIVNPHFFVFSDDLDWVSKNLNLINATYVDVNTVENPENDLVLMSNCNHNIIANSTFSWWGAWLNNNENKIVIAPKKWMSNVNSLDDLYPKEWLRL